MSVNRLCGAAETVPIWQNSQLAIPVHTRVSAFAPGKIPTAGLAPPPRRLRAAPPWRLRSDRAEACASARWVVGAKKDLSARAAFGAELPKAGDGS